MIEPNETPSAENLPENRYLNRELSWLDFNDRVLVLADDRDAPLLERAKFLAIFASNLDEFFMVRVAGLKRQVAAGVSSRSVDGLSPKKQLSLIAENLRPVFERHAEVFEQVVAPGLAEKGVLVRRWGDLEDRQRKELDDLFMDRIFPVVTPLAVDPGHPFPYISNLSLNLAVLVRDPDLERVHFARVKVPPLLPRFVSLEDDTIFVPLEDVIAANLDQLFPGMEIVEHHAFRVTRNADLEVNDDGAEDLLLALEEELRKRRFSPAVRLEIERSMPPRVLELLMRELEVSDDDVFPLPGPLDLSGLWDLYEIDRPDLKDEPFHPVSHPDLSGADGEEVDVFSVLNDTDILVHHPYESFATSVERFIEQAAGDRNVLAIKQTLYRTSGDSPIVEALAAAAEAGKQVVVLVEIKARFDERNNIQWARALERAGCHVVYGLVGLKTHCKLCMVVRKEGRHLRRYVHVGTGNYNPKTARLYEDIGLLTADPQLGADVGHLFNYLTGYSRQTSYRSLIVSPHMTRDRIVAMIDREIEHVEAGDGGYIAMKMNSLVDESVVDALYRASGAGVKIDLIVRGICALRPRVPDLSENITVRSIVGRFLEHSRIYYFAGGGADEIYIGSADLMHRNLDRRVEALVSVSTPTLKARLCDFLALCMRDNTMSWDLGPDGAWTKRMPAAGEQPVALQTEMMLRAGGYA